jgi:transcriptional regulator with XRE-family HTH domain
MNIRLKSQILRRGLSQLQIARELGLNDSYISRIVHGWVIPTPEIKSKLANLLKCEIHEIFDDQENKE